MYGAKVDVWNIYSIVINQIGTMSMLFVSISRADKRTYQLENQRPFLSIPYHIDQHVMSYKYHALWISNWYHDSCLVGQLTYIIITWELWFLVKNNYLNFFFMDGYSFVTHHRYLQMVGRLNSVDVTMRSTVLSNYKQCLLPNLTREVIARLA